MSCPLPFFHFLAYYLLIFSKFAFAKEENPTLKNIPVSVIVCAKNEANNIGNLISKLLEQDYKQFEIVLINDASSDDTLEVMESFKEIHSNIKIVNIVNNETFWGNKKYEFTLGIKAASYDFLLFTDADCTPNSKHWISSMSSHFTNDKSIIIGYGSYAKQHKSFLNKLIRFETLLTANQYFLYAKITLSLASIAKTCDFLFFENAYGTAIKYGSYIYGDNKVIMWKYWFNIDYTIYCICGNNYEP